MTNSASQVDGTKKVTLKIATWDLRLTTKGMKGKHICLSFKLSGGLEGGCDTMVNVYVILTATTVDHQLSIFPVKFIARRKYVSLKVCLGVNVFHLPSGQ